MRWEGNGNSGTLSNYRKSQMEEKLELEAGTAVQGGSSCRLDCDGLLGLSLHGDSLSALHVC